MRTDPTITENPVYTSMVAGDFPNQNVARDYVAVVMRNIVPKVRAAGAASARVVAFTDTAGNIIKCESQYTWPSHEALILYRRGQASAEIKQTVARFLDEGVVLTPSAGNGSIVLEDRV